MYGASIDAVVLSGYGQEIQRPRGVPADWTLKRRSGRTVYATYEEAAAEVEAMDRRALEAGNYPAGWDIPQNADGTWGPVTYEYWAPAGGRGQSDLALATGLTSSVFCGVTLLAVILM